MHAQHARTRTHADGGVVRPYDVRLRREISHRRLAISLLRRGARVLALHLLDATILVAVLLAVASWDPALRLRPFVFPATLIFLLSLNAFRAYRAGEGRRDRARLFGGVSLGLLILAVFANFPPHLPLDPALLGLIGASALAGLVLGRKAVDLLVRQAYAHGIGLRRGLLIGSLDEVGYAIRELRDDQNVDHFIVGHLSAGAGADPTALGDVSELPDLLDEGDIEEVVVAAELPAEQLREVVQSCFERGTSLYMLPSVYVRGDCRGEPCRVGPVTLLRVHPNRLEMPALLIKRLFDICIAGLALVLLAPIMVLISIAVRIDSPGPVFFRQRRCGLGGRYFTIWKFRCMYADAEERRSELEHLNIYGDPRLFKLPQDPRVTRVGRWLRRSSLDELPQLFNVVAGDMSLVGPRPPLPDEVARYESHHFERLSVVPGITGPWQVNGRNLITDFERVVELERDYIRSWSLRTDARILFRTPGVVLRGYGAY
ncbi:MAG: sugar transferase [Longimicrobiaceae bacterium]